jgi:Tetratricopeptide repeat
LWVRATNRNFALVHFWLGAALARLGRVEEARAATKAGLALNPVFTISRFRHGAWSNNPAYLAQRERIYDGMIKARVPKG